MVAWNLYYTSEAIIDIIEHGCLHLQILRHRYTRSGIGSVAAKLFHGSFFPYITIAMS